MDLLIAGAALLACFIIIVAFYKPDEQQATQLDLNEIINQLDAVTSTVELELLKSGKDKEAAGADLTRRAIWKALEGFKDEQR